MKVYLTKLKRVNERKNFLQETKLRGNIVDLQNFELASHQNLDTLFTT